MEVGQTPTPSLKASKSAPSPLAYSEKIGNDKNIVNILAERSEFTQLVVKLIGVRVGFRILVREGRTTMTPPRYMRSVPKLLLYHPAKYIYRILAGMTLLAL